MFARSTLLPRTLGSTLLLALMLGLSLAGCQDSSRTFAGFTFGGGGNTFSCEPAVITLQGPNFELRAGTPGSNTSILLTGQGATTLGQEAPLSAAQVQVPEHEGQAVLVSGSLVQQTQEGETAHGSFDLRVKGADGREFQVVGSYTASVVEGVPSSGASPQP